MRAREAPDNNLRPSFAESDRGHSIIGSPTAVSDSRASDLIDLSGGDVRLDLELPPAVALGTADDRMYSSTAGSSALRQVIASQANARGLPESQVKNVLIGPGARTVLFAAFRALLEPGDDVILPTPYWPSYTEMIRLAGGTPVHLTQDLLGSALTERSTPPRMIVVNSPRNPTGSFLGVAELRSIGEWAIDNDVWIVADEVYAALTFESDRAPSILEAVPEVASRTVIIDGLSKSLAMAGLRLGWSIGPEHVTEAMTAIMSHLTANTSNAVQRYALSAIPAMDGLLPSMKSRLQLNARDLSAGLDAIAGIHCRTPSAGLFSFPNVSPAMEMLGLEDDLAFVSHLADSARVKVVPGSAFGSPGHVRVSFAVDEAVIAETLSRLRATLGLKSERFP